MDDVDSADQNSIRSEDGHETKHKKRAFLKDAIGRTKTKLNKVREERVAKRQSNSKAEHALDDNVNDFLAGGRASFASSQRPSLGSEAQREQRIGALTLDPVLATDRPSTSDSNTQQSPRRVPQVSVPRIDVSSSSRFPNARPVNPDDVLLDQEPITNLRPTNGSLLKPEYKSRSQSASSLASGKHRAKLRGLSVGFADVPPVVIGEGGDEAEAPSIEISRAKEARARSASPQARKPYGNTSVQSETRRPMLTQAISENTADTMPPKPFMRVQTGTLANTMSSRSARGSLPDELLPKPFARTQTGLADHTNTSISPIATTPSKPAAPFVTQPLARIDTGNELAKEFEMSLGLPTGRNDSPIVMKKPISKPFEIVAPKPQRAPPSYEGIESGDNSPAAGTNRPTLPAVAPRQSPSSSQIVHQNTQSEQVNRRPVPRSQSSHQPDLSAPKLDQNSSKSITISNTSGQQLPPLASSRPNFASKPGSQDYFPPPQLPNTKSKAAKSQLPKPNSLPQSDTKSTAAPIVSDNKVPLSVVTEQQDSYQSFAQRSRFRSNSNSPRPSLGSVTASPQTATIRHVTNQYFDDVDEVQESPRTAVELKNGGRFYESMNRKDSAGGFI